MLVSLPALNDNYIWVYRRENFPVIIVDISEVTALLPFLQENQLDVEAVLLTHKHDDHVAGVAEFKKYYLNVPIYGPAETLDKGATEIIDQGIIFTKHYQIKVIPTGGHTEQHVSYLVDDHLFCGDVLFLLAVAEFLRETISRCLIHFKLLNLFLVTRYFVQGMNIL